MSKHNIYTIEIKFDHKGLEKTIFTGAAEYRGSIYTDDFDITNNKIIIKAKRSAIIQLDNILYNHSSTIYNQILKSLLFYYSSIKEFAKIIEIVISRTRSQNILEKKVFDDTEFNQVLDNSFKLNNEINQLCLQEIFNETPKGQSIMIAISYLLISNTVINENDKFEKLWKSFNKLYTHIAGTNSDFECLRHLREFIINNPNILTLSASIIDNLTTDKLRNSIRWRDMILDNYQNEAKTESFKDFIIRYSDERIMNILLATNYGYREKFLKNKGLFTIVDTHIQNSIAAKIKINNEIVLLLTGKYMYYVRNKSFHGEKIDSTLRLLVNKEDKEFKFLNKILELYLIDLINANNLY